MDLRRLLRVVSAACEGARARWAIIGDVPAATLPEDRHVDEVHLALEGPGRGTILESLRASGFEVVSITERFSTLLREEPGPARLRLMWLEEDSAKQVFRDAKFLAMPGLSNVLAVGSMPWDIYFDFLKQFTPTKAQLEALPLSPDVPPFRLD